MSDNSSNNVVVDGPCGACKFLRRKCVRWCIFAPYFDQDQGIAHFAAVHRVFGASNFSKLLLTTPPHRRMDAVVTLCYEALARVKDPVYGCVGHIFALQQQVLNLQAELAHVQARISMLQRGPSLTATPVLPGEVLSSFGDHCSSGVICNSTSHKAPFDDLQLDDISTELVSFCNSIGQEIFEDGDLESMAQEYVSRYFPGLIFKPPASM